MQAQRCLPGCRQSLRFPGTVVHSPAAVTAWRLVIACRCAAQPSPDVMSDADWAARRRARTKAEILDAAKRSGKPVDAKTLAQALDELEHLIPGFEISLDAMRASDWVTLVADINAVASKIVLLKTAYPTVDLAKVLFRNPKALLKSSEQLAKDAGQVNKLLAEAKNLAAILETTPELLDPKWLVSVLVSLNKWYDLKKDPVAILDNDPEIIQRSQVNDVPFDPVFLDEDGNWTAPLLHYKEKRAPWQAYIDRVHFKQPD